MSTGMLVSQAVPAANKLSDTEVLNSVRLESPDSRFGPEGMIGNLTGGQVIDDSTTQTMHTQSVRLAKFMDQLRKNDLDQLQEVPQPNGDTAWTYDAAIDDQDFNFAILKSDLLGSINFTEAQSDEEIQEVATKHQIDPEQAYIVIDGKKYFVRMDIPMHFGTGTNSDSWINMGVFVLAQTGLSAAIAAVVAQQGIAAFSDVFKNLSTALFKTLWALLRVVLAGTVRFLWSFFGSLLGGESLSAAVSAGATAFGEEASAAVEGLTSEVLAAALGAAILITALLLIVELVLHESYQNVYVYNLTKYDMSFDFSYKDEGAPHNVPNKMIPAAKERKGSGGIDLGTWYSGVGFRYQSDSEFQGLGYAMQFDMKDPATQDVVKTFSCLFDVPFDGDNSLYASVGDSDESYYDQHEGQNQTTQYSADDGEHEIIVTYDYLSGEHTDPESGQDLYLYTSLVVIRKKPSDGSGAFAAFSLDA